MTIKYSPSRTIRLLVCCLPFIAAVGIPSLTIAASAAESKPAMLPAGYLSVRGNQIVDSNGTSVRIACVGGFGTDIVGGRLGYDHGPYHGVDENVAAIQRFGFNCVRVDWNDKSLHDPVLMSQFDQLVAACGKYGVKVIFDNHNNEATSANYGNASQQSNGLWFDVGPGSDGTDGGGDRGTVSSDQFLQDWVTFAKRWAGNPTVIGFDIRNEPVRRRSSGPLWGGDGPTDIHAMYQNVGNAILAVNPNVLIVCEAVIRNNGFDSYQADFVHPEWLPIVLSNPAKIVYSVHEYPKEVTGDTTPDSGPVYIDRLNRTWGWLIRQDIAPVWIGEMGSSMNTPAGVAWAKTLLDYMNGVAPSGIRFSKNQQPVSGDWWWWGCQTGVKPNACLTEEGNLRPEMADTINQMMFRPTSSDKRHSG